MTTDHEHRTTNNRLSTMFDKEKSQMSDVRCQMRGFTILELMIVIAILTIIFGFSLVSGSGFYYNQALITERDNVVSLLRNARSRALNNTNQLNHGVFINTSTKQYVVFDGVSYAARNQTYDVTFPALSVVAISGPAEIVFTALEGASSASGTIILSAGTGAANIPINNEGRISW